VQSKKQSILESVANFITAFILGYAVTYFLVPILWHTEVAADKPIAFVLLLNVLSTLRHYVWRRIFNRFGSE
jgi:hypothetical protein